MCVLECGGVTDLRSMQCEVVISPACTILLCECTTIITGNDFDFRWLNVWNRCCVGPGRTVRKFVSPHMQLNLKAFVISVV